MLDSEVEICEITVGIINVLRIFEQWSGLTRISVQKATEDLGKENLGVLSNYKDLHPMRDAMRSEALVDYYFGIIGRMDSK